MLIDAIDLLSERGDILQITDGENNPSILIDMGEPETSTLHKSDFDRRCHLMA